MTAPKASLPVSNHISHSGGKTMGPKLKLTLFNATFF